MNVEVTGEKKTIAPAASPTSAPLAINYGKYCGQSRVFEDLSEALLGFTAFVFFTAPCLA